MMHIHLIGGILSHIVEISLTLLSGSGVRAVLVNYTTHSPGYNVIGRCSGRCGRRRRRLTTGCTRATLRRMLLLLARVSTNDELERVVARVAERVRARFEFHDGRRVAGMHQVECHLYGVRRLLFVLVDELQLIFKHRLVLCDAELPEVLF